MAIIQRSSLYKITFACFISFILTSGISITLSQGMLLVTLILWLYGWIRKIPDFHYYKTSIEIYIAQFIVISAILALLSPSRIENLLYLRDFWLISAFVIASSLLKTKEDLIKIFYFFIIVAVIQSLAAYIQYFADINYLNAMKYGFDDPRSRLSMGKIVVGFLGHHLTFGGYMMMISFPVFYMSFLKKKDNPGFPAYVTRASAVMSLITIILSWSRSVIIAMPFTIIPLIIKNKKKFFITFGIILVSIFVVLSEFGPSNNFFKNMMDDSSMIRIQIWRNVLNVCRQNILFGAGGANYTNVFYKEAVKNKKIDDGYFTALKRYNKYKNNLIRIELKKFIADRGFIEIINEFQDAELIFNESESEYWGIDYFFLSEYADYSGASDRLASEELWHDKFIKIYNSVLDKYNEEHKLFAEIKKRHDESGELFYENFPSMVTHAHNDYLNQLARKGIIGLLSFLYMLYGILKYMFYNMKSINDRSMRYFYMGLFGSFTAFLIASMFQCYYTDDECLVMLWLNTGILAGIVKVAGKNSYELQVTCNS